MFEAMNKLHSSNTFFGFDLFGLGNFGEPFRIRFLRNKR
jgi:hypothetical protein